MIQERKRLNSRGVPGSRGPPRARGGLIGGRLGAPVETAPEAMDGPSYIETGGSLAASTLLLTQTMPYIIRYNPYHLDYLN